MFSTLKWMDLYMFYTKLCRNKTKILRHSKYCKNLIGRRNVCVFNLIFSRDSEECQHLVTSKRIPLCNVLHSRIYVREVHECSKYWGLDVLLYTLVFK
jgi:hypothetical protein